jgi:hypothetical protein
VATLRTRLPLLFSLIFLGLFVPPARTASSASSATEQQLKAVFLFNFAHFVQWPTGTFGNPTEPFVIGVLGGDALATQLDEAVRGERIDQHPLEVHRFRSVEELGGCQILFIEHTAAAQLERALALLQHRSTLTVSDLEGASRRGVMIQFATQENRIRLLINVDSAKAARLTISSNLLRPAEIVRGP